MLRGGDSPAEVPCTFCNPGRRLLEVLVVKVRSRLQQLLLYDPFHAILLCGQVIAGGFSRPTVCLINHRLNRKSFVFSAKPAWFLRDHFQSCMHRAPSLNRSPPALPIGVTPNCLQTLQQKYCRAPPLVRALRPAPARSAGRRGRTIQPVTLAEPHCQSRGSRRCCTRCLFSRHGRCPPSRPCHPL